MRGYKPVVDNVPLKGSDGFSASSERPFILTLGNAFQVIAILLALSLMAQSGMAFMDIDGSDYELIKWYVMYAGFILYACVILCSACTPFYSLITKRPRKYVFYQMPYIHLLFAIYIALLACPDLLFDDDDINEIQCSFWVISLIMIGLYAVWCVLALVHRRKIKDWASNSA